MRGVRAGCQIQYWETLNGRAGWAMGLLRLSFCHVMFESLSPRAEAAGPSRRHRREWVLLLAKIGQGQGGGQNRGQPPSKFAPSAMGRCAEATRQSSLNSGQASQPAGSGKGLQLVHAAAPPSCRR